MRRLEDVMGTVITVDVRHPAVKNSDLDDVFAWLRWVDDTFSTYKEHSQLSRLGRGETTVAACDPDVGWVLARCEELRRQTGGFFDCHATGILDPSGLVKGWSVEVASGMLARAGWANHFINAGGDVRVQGVPEPGRLWQIGIAHPLVRDALTVVVAGSDIAVATSGTAERGLHVIDPVRDRPADAFASVTIVGSDLGTTDAMATAALAMGFDAAAWLENLPGHEAYVIDADGNVWWTSGMPEHAPALRELPRPRLTAAG